MPSAKTTADRFAGVDADSIQAQHAAVAARFRDLMVEMSKLVEHMEQRSPGTLLYLRLLQTQLASLRYMEALAELQILAAGG